MIEPQVDSPGFLFDLDGTLIDSVYQHVLAWQEALTADRDRALGVADPSPHRHERRVVRHRADAGDRSVDCRQDAGRALQPRARRGLSPDSRDTVRPLPGARELLATLTEPAVHWAIATSGQADAAGPHWRCWACRPTRPVVTRDQVRYAKPDPDLFLAAADRLGVDIQSAIVVGDSIWDLLAARRARALGVGLLSGGYGREELERAGAYRVYADPVDLLTHLDEVGVRGVAD